MAESNEEMNFCKNCKRNISSQNFMMHSLHCQRNLVLCNLCNGCYPRNVLQVHIDDDHAIICCLECGVNIEKLYLEKHKELHCKHRLIQCRFCGIENPLIEMKEHESYCGSRTERCDFCKQFVMIKDEVEHCAKVHNKTVKLDFHVPVDSKVLNGISNVEKEKITKKDSYSNSASSLSGTSSSKVNVLSMNKRTNDMPQLNTSVPDKNTKSVQKVPLATDALVSEETFNINNDCLSDEVIARQIADEEECLANSQSAHRPLPSFDSVMSRSVSAQNLIPAAGHISEILNNISDSESETLRNEGLNCFPSDVLYNSLDEPFTSENYLSHSDSDVCLNSFDVNEQEIILTSVKSKLNVNFQNDSKECIPCEFCDESIPLKLLMKHEVECGHDKQVDYDQQNDVITRARPQGWNSINQDEDVDEIPCEFCEALFPFSEIGTHQASCNQNPLLHDTSDACTTNNATSGVTSQKKSRNENLLNDFENMDGNESSVRALTSFMYDDSYVVLPPLSKTENLAIDKKKQIQDSNNVCEQNKKSTSTRTNFAQATNQSFPIRNHLYSPTVDYVSSENVTMRTDFHPNSGNKENNLLANMNGSDNVYEQTSTSLHHSEMNDYLKDMCMQVNANIADRLQEKENCIKKNVINHEPDKAILQVRNTYHRSDIHKVDKETVNDENFRRPKNNHHINNKMQNFHTSKYSSASPRKNLYLNEMKAALHPVVSNSHETDVGSDSGTAWGAGARPRAQNSSSATSHQRNSKRGVPNKNSKFQEPKNIRDRNGESFRVQPDNSNDEAVLSYLPNSDRITGAVPKMNSRRNLDHFKK